MNKVIDEIFKHKKIAMQRLAEYGFKEENGGYVLERTIADGQMTLKVSADGNGELSTKVIDCDTGDEYTLFLSDEADGDFVNQVRGEYRNILEGIAENCCQRQVFKSRQAQEIIAYVRQKYGDELEFLWEKFDDNAIWRRKDNKKWYGAVLKVKRRTIGLDGEDKIEVLDLRATPDTVAKIDGRKYFSAYHMNKKNWISICLDGSCDIQEIKNLLDISYNLALKK